MQNLNDLLTAPANCIIECKRVVNAIPEEVFEAWTNPAHLKNWWGPAGFTNTFHQFDLRPGGTWKFTMHGPEKGNYENEVVFLSIEKPRLIAWRRISKPHFNILAQFGKVTDSTTEVDFRMIFATEEECDKLKAFVPDKNEENMDKLEEVLRKMRS